MEKGRAQAYYLVLGGLNTRRCSRSVSEESVEEIRRIVGSRFDGGRRCRVLFLWDVCSHEVKFGLASQNVKKRPLQG